MGPRKETTMRHRAEKSIDSSPEMDILSTDLELQHKYVERLKKGGEKGFTLIAAEAFVRGMRESGYRNTGTAIDEFIDNAIQAQANQIDVIYTAEKPKGGQQEITNIAIIDNGHGMEPDMIRAAVLWGGTHRENDRKGFGRFGFGLPSAAVSITKHFEVYSRIKEGEWYRVCVDLDDICNGKLTNNEGLVVAPPAEKTDLPDMVKEFLADKTLEHGTVILTVSPDRLTSGFRRPQQFQEKLLEQLGLIYRGLLNRCGITVNGKKVEPVDPLFLDPNARYYDVGNNVFAEAMAPLQFEAKSLSGAEGSVRLRFSYMHPQFQVGPGSERNNERFSIMKQTNAYFIVTRAGRQIDLVTRPNYNKDSHNITLINFDRNWAIELDFDPILDEDFGITVNKQQVEISERMWQMLMNQNLPAIVEGFRKRFKKDKVDLESSSREEEKKTSEDIMTEADKFRPTPPPVSPERQEKAREKVIVDAEETAKRTKRPKEEVVKEIIEAISLKRYEVRLEALEGAPFYRVEQYGPQQRLFINNRHRFYTDLYAAADSTTRVKTALELLLFVLGSCELESTDDRQIFYRTERAEWSKRFDVTLDLLDRRDSVIDAGSASEEESEVTPAQA